VHVTYLDISIVYVTCESLIVAASGVVSRLCAGWPRIQFLIRWTDFSLSRNTQASARAQPTYSMGTGGKAAGAGCWWVTSI